MVWGTRAVVWGAGALDLGAAFPVASDTVARGAAAGGKAEIPLILAAIFAVVVFLGGVAGTDSSSRTSLSVSPSPKRTCLFPFFGVGRCCTSVK